MAGFIQEAFRGFLKCLGLEVVVDNPPPPSSILLDPAASTTDIFLVAADDTHTPTNDPSFDVLSSPNGGTVDNNLGGQNNFTLVTIDEIVNTIGGTTTEAHYAELLDDGQSKTSIFTTSLISSGGGGKSH